VHQEEQHRRIVRTLDACANQSFCALQAARAAFDATSRFHNPAHVAEWSDAQIDAAYEQVRSLVLRGLAQPTRAPKGKPARARASQV
jgi:Tetracyclin repressor-like, C-terminal domain